MAVSYELVFDGGTIDQYNQVLEKMGFEHGGPSAPGGLFHWVTETDGGFRVVDVWASDEVFQKFADEQIGPYSQEVGLSEPRITRTEVYNYLTAGPPA